MEDLEEKIAAGEQLMWKTLQALRDYKEAKGVKPAAEVEHLRVEAEALMTAVSKCQLWAPGGPVHLLN